MSTFRKTVLTTAIIGAGLASTTGSAFATECHDGDHHGKSSHEHSTSASSKGCSNTFGPGVDNGGSTNKLALLNGNAGAIQSNICDVLNRNLNGNLSNNSIALPGL